MNKPRQTSAAPKSRPAATPASTLGRPESGLRQRLFTVIFESDTRPGRLFDFVLIGVILTSVVVVMLDSVARFSQRYGEALDVLEWTFTVLFTIEYIARLVCIKRPLRYATSFFGIVDLLSVLPTYAAFFIPELHALIDLRLLRMLRMFRLLKLTEYVEEYSLLGSALIASRRKILIFLSVVAIIVVLHGTLLYVIEGGPDTKFSSIPTSIYFSIASITTVGFGDIAPLTDLGRAITSFSMLIGWSILAVPTGIITSEMTSQRFSPRTDQRTCPECQTSGLEDSDSFCRNCGARLPAIDG
jgi:voltage-gated potassium channel